MFVVGEQAELVLYTVEGELGRDPVTGPVAWTSSHAAIAVDDGIVTASGAAAGKITATIQGVRTEAQVIALPGALEGLALSPPAIALALGQTGRVAAIADLADGTADVSAATIWSSDQPTVVEVTNGSLRRIGAGDATLTAIAGDLTATVLVTTPP